MSGFIDTMVVRTFVPARGTVLPGAVRPQVRALFEPEPGGPIGGVADIDERADDIRAPAQALPAPQGHDRPAGQAADRAATRSATGHADVRVDTRPAARTASAPDRPAQAGSLHPVPPAPLPPPLPSAPPPAQQAAAPSIPAPDRMAPPAPRPERQPAGTMATAEQRAARPALPQTDAVAMPDTWPRRAAAGPVPLSSPPPALTAGALRPAPPPVQAVSPGLAVPPPRRPASAAHHDRRDRHEDAAARDAAPVHVSIGRIEIRAVAPPPAPARRERAAPQPLGLDDYLRQRARGDKP